MASPSPNKFNIPQSAFQIARPIDSPSYKVSSNSTPRKNRKSNSKQNITPRKQATPSKPGTLSFSPNYVILSCNSLIDFRDKYMKEDEEIQTEPTEIATSPIPEKRSS